MRLLRQGLKLSQKRLATLFKANPFETTLRNHTLKGRYIGFRSFDVSGDVRVLYTTSGNTIIIFGFIASHSQLY